MPPGSTQSSIAKPHRSSALLIALALLAIVVIAVYVLYVRHHQSTASASALTSAQTAFNAGNYSEALDDVNVVLSTEPDNVSALILKANALNQEAYGSYNAAQYTREAVAAAQLAIQKSSDSSDKSDAYQALGYAYELQKDYPDALTAYQSSLALDPNGALSEEAHIYELQGNWTQAETAYSQALSVNSRDASAYLGLGRINSATGDASSSLQNFQQAYQDASTTQQRAEAAYSLGMLTLAQGNINMGTAYVGVAAHLDPNFPLAWLGLGIAYFEQSLATTTTAKAHLETESTAAITSAVESAGFPSTAIAAQSPYAEDLYVLGNPNTALTLISAASTTVSNATTSSPGTVSKSVVLQMFNAFAAFIQDGPPVALTH